MLTFQPCEGLHKIESKKEKSEKEEEIFTLKMVLRYCC